MNCQRCNGPRLLQVCGKTSDMCSLNRVGTNKSQNDYVPGGIGLGNDEDYIELVYCLDCGQICSEFPISEKKLPKDLRR